jgi:hypothetical protein
MMLAEKTVHRLVGDHQEAQRELAGEPATQLLM